MTDLVAELADRSRALTPEQRVRLLDLLLESLHQSPATEVDAAWNVEIERRVAAYERGEAELHEAEDVMAEAARIAP